jgi:hypothetical protein
MLLIKLFTLKPLCDIKVTEGFCFMKTYNAKFLEDQLTRRLNKKVELSKQGYYSSEEMALYRKIYIEGRDSGIKIDLEDLTEYERRGILDRQLDKLAAKLNGEKNG